MTKPQTHEHNPARANTDEDVDLGRRHVLAGVAAASAAGAATVVGSQAHAATDEAKATYADPENPALPDMDMDIDPERTALVVVDPQVDFLDPNGVAWEVVGESVRETSLSQVGCKRASQVMYSPRSNVVT